MKIHILVIAFALGVTASHGQTSESARHLNVDENVALEGYDAVAYFRHNKPLKGKKEFVIRDEGALYMFSSPENRDLFKKSPQKYKPEYGGWCAYAMGETGEKVPVDPETYKILNGKLYLFYNRFFNNTLTKWNANENKLLLQADQNWKKIMLTK